MLGRRVRSVNRTLRGVTHMLPGAHRVPRCVRAQSVFMYSTMAARCCAVSSGSQPACTR